MEFVFEIGWCGNLDNGSGARCYGIATKTGFLRGAKITIFNAIESKMINPNYDRDN